MTLSYDLVSFAQDINYYSKHEPVDCSFVKNVEKLSFSTNVETTAFICVVMEEKYEWE